MAEILVTGGTGLVGKELIKQLLSEGKSVRATYHSSLLSEITDPNLELVKCDILDIDALAEAMKGITKVYHCAAIVSFDPKQRQRLYEVNITGTANVVNACLNEGVAKLLHVSSVAALGRNLNHDIVDEELKWQEEKTYSAYAKSKYLGEMEVWRGVGEGLNAVIVNPSVILGGNTWEKGSSAVFRSAYNEFPWYTEGGTGFVDVKDVAAAMILLMNSEIINERFILNGDNRSFKELFSSIATGFGKRSPHKKVNPFLAGIVWRAEAFKATFSGASPLLTKETAESALACVSYSNEKIKRQFPQFKFTPFDKTIKDTCATLKNKYHL